MKIVKVDRRFLDHDFLIEDALDAFERKYKMRPPVKRRVTGNRSWAWYSGEISLRLSFTERGTLASLAHELSHILSFKQGDRAHGKLFYENLYHIATLVGADLEHIARDEKSYKPLNYRAFEALRKKNGR